MRSSEEIRRRIKSKEKREGRPLSKQERRKIEKNVIRKHRKENIIRALFLSLGIVAGATTTKALDRGRTISSNQPKQEQTIEQDSTMANQTIEQDSTIANQAVEQDSTIANQAIEQDSTMTNQTTEQYNTQTKEKTYDDFKDSLHVNSNDTINYNQVEQEIINEFNQINNDNLTKDDVAYLLSKPQFIGIDENNQYIQDYKEETKVSQYKTSGIGNIYVAIDRRDNSVIYSVGKIDNKVANVDTKVVMKNDSNGQRIEYFKSNKAINPTLNKDEKSINNIYETMEYEFDKQQKQMQERNDEIKSR